MRHYDITTKHLIEGRPRDLLAFAGVEVGPNAVVTVVDADLSAITTAADKLIRVDEGAASYLTHFEFQSGVDVDLDQRMAVYNVLAGWRHKLSVRTVLIALRPEAVSPKNTGRFQRAVNSRSRLDFEYEIVPVWKLPADMVLSGGIGAIPFAPICDTSGDDPAAVIDRMRHRFETETSPVDASELWAATRILMGLKYEKATIDLLLRGVFAMKESVTYQEIVEVGRIEGERNALTRLASQRFGPPDPVTAAKLKSIFDLSELIRLNTRLLTASNWDDLLGRV